MTQTQQIVWWLVIFWIVCGFISYPVTKRFALMYENRPSRLLFLLRIRYEWTSADAIVASLLMVLGPVTLLTSTWLLITEYAYQRKS